MGQNLTVELYVKDKKVLNSEKFQIQIKVYQTPECQTNKCMIALYRWTCRGDFDLMTSDWVVEGYKDILSYISICKQ